jgi:hypothetical protein
MCFASGSCVWHQLVALLLLSIERIERSSSLLSAAATAFAAFFNGGLASYQFKLVALCPFL